MILTNKYNLPPPIIEAIRNDGYSKGAADWSITELIDSPRVAVLKRRHDHEIETDASEMVWSVLGRAVHSLFEKGAGKAGLKDYSEQRLYLKRGKFTVSGGMDLWEEGDGRLAISDFKLTKAKSVYLPKANWEKQLNLYRILYREHFGKDPNELRVIAVCRDWQKELVGKLKDYPESPMVPIQLPLWKLKDAYSYLDERIALHAAAKGAEIFDEEPALCTDDERWMRKPTWAIRKEGNKKATSVFSTEERASDALVEIEKKNTKKAVYSIEYRAASPHRCLEYCEVSRFCSQFDYAQANAAEEEPDSAELEE